MGPYGAHAPLGSGAPGGGGQRIGGAVSPAPAEAWLERWTAEWMQDPAPAPEAEEVAVVFPALLMADRQQPAAVLVDRLHALQRPDGSFAGGHALSVTAEVLAGLLAGFARPSRRGITNLRRIALGAATWLARRVAEATSSGATHPIPEDPEAGVPNSWRWWPAVAVLLRAGTALDQPAWSGLAMGMRDHLLGDTAPDAWAPSAWTWRSGEFAAVQEALLELGLVEAAAAHMAALAKDHLRPDGGVPATSGAAWVDTAGHLRCGRVWARLGEEDQARDSLAWAASLALPDGGLVARIGRTPGTRGAATRSGASATATALLLGLRRLLPEAPEPIPQRVHPVHPAATRVAVTGLLPSAPWRGAGEPVDSCARDQGAALAAAFRGAAPPRWLQPVLTRIQPGDTVLQLGCGNDAAPAWLARRGAAVTLVDRTAAALDRAAVLFERLDLRAEGVLADATGCLPFPAARFDVVWCRGILPTCSDGERIRVLHEARRVARREVIATVPNRRCIALRLGRPDTPGCGSLVDGFRAAGLEEVAESTWAPEGALHFLRGGELESLRNVLGSWFARLDPGALAELGQGEWLCTTGTVPGDQAAGGDGPAAAAGSGVAVPDGATGAPHTGWIPHRPMDLVWLWDPAAGDPPACLTGPGLRLRTLSPWPLADGPAASAGEAIAPEDLTAELGVRPSDALLAPTRRMAIWARNGRSPGAVLLGVAGHGPSGPDGEPAPGDVDGIVVLPGASPDAGSAFPSERRLAWPGQEDGREDPATALRELALRCGAGGGPGSGSGPVQPQGSTAVSPDIRVLLKGPELRDAWNHAALSSPEAGPGHLADAPSLLGAGAGADLSFALELDGRLAAICPVFRDPLDPDRLISGTALGGGPAVAGHIQETAAAQVRAAAWRQLHRIRERAGARELQVIRPPLAPASRALWSHGIHPLPSRGLTTDPARLLLAFRRERATANPAQIHRGERGHPPAGEAPDPAEPTAPLRMVDAGGHHRSLDPRTAASWLATGRLLRWPATSGDPAGPESAEMLWCLWGDTALCLWPAAPDPGGRSTRRCFDHLAGLGIRFAGWLVAGDDRDQATRPVWSGTVLAGAGQEGPDTPGGSDGATETGRDRP